MNTYTSTPHNYQIPEDNNATGARLFGRWLSITQSLLLEFDWPAEELRAHIDWINENHDYEYDRMTEEH